MSDNNSSGSSNSSRPVEGRNRFSGNNSSGNQSNKSNQSNNQGGSAQSYQTGRYNRCTQCGKDSRHEVYPAMGRQCFNCRWKDHFKHMCKFVAQTIQSQTAQPVTTQTQQPDLITQVPPTESSDPGNGQRLAFTLRINSCKLHRSDVSVGGVKVRCIIDSGADCNVIDRKTWEHLKANNVKVRKSSKCDPKIFSYLAQAPLDVIGQFWANITNESGD